MSDKFPELGQLVTLHHYNKKLPSLYVGNLDENGEDTEVKCGTIAMVVGFRVRNGFHGKNKVTIISFLGKIGWIFNDEWQAVEPEEPVQ